MVSRDTRVHAVVIALTLAVFAVLSSLSPPDGTQTAALLAVGFNAIAYGGAHAYLLWRGEDGLVPVESRRRFVALVAVVAVLSVVGVTADASERIAGVKLWTVLLVVGLAAGAVYWLLEARAGYERSQSARA